MKLVGITQRVERVESYNERRDCLDQRWHMIAEELGWLLVPLPNIAPEQVPTLVDTLQLSAVILSGGNTLAFLNPDAPDAAPERDAFEAALIDLSLDNQLPLLGVCRGMQAINHHLGGELGTIDHHVRTRHQLLYRDGPIESLMNVNSFHNVVVTKVADGFEVLARHSDGTVEAFRHRAKKIMGIMWHPEREKELQSQDRIILEGALS